MVKEEGGGADHLLLALWVSGFEQIRVRDKHEPGRLRAAQHHARAAQDVRFEYLTIPVVNIMLERERREREREEGKVWYLFCLSEKKMLGSL